jgi:hypothetical protein
MTVGSFVRDNTRLVTMIQNGEANGQLSVGRYESKTWSGGDSPKGTFATMRIRRAYTTVDRRGKVIKRSFYVQAPKRARRLLPHDYSMSSYQYRSNPGKVERSWTYDGIWGMSSVEENWVLPSNSPELPTLPAWSSNDDLKLINKLKLKLRGSDFNMSVFLGEGHQTLNMIGDSAIRIARGLNLFRKGNVIGAVNAMSKSAKQALQVMKTIRSKLWSTHLRRNATNQSSSNWLELQYGWLPLLGDIKSGAELLAHQLNVPFMQRYVVRRSVRSSPDQGGSYIKFADYSSSVNKQIVAYVSEPESIPKMSGILDPELVAWELTPFSFVADWVLPIGEFLEARAFASSLTGTFVTTTFEKQTARGICGGEFNNPPHISNGKSSMTGVEMHASKVTLNRVVSTSLSVPMPAVKPLSKALSLGHCLNGLALLAQVARKPINHAPLESKFLDSLKLTTE